MSDKLREALLRLDRATDALIEEHLDKAREYDFGFPASLVDDIRAATTAVERAALAQPSEPELDVERLARALLLHTGEFIKQPESFDSRRLVAENIARIYDRLASEPTDET